MKGFSLILVCVLLVLTSAVALAQDEEQWNAHEGLYAELNLGTNLWYLGAGSSEYDASNGGFEGFAWTCDIGYSFTPYHAIEGGFMQNYVGYDFDNEIDVNANTNVIYLAYRGTIPIKDRFALFGKLGAMFFTFHGSETSTNTEGESAWFGLPFSGIGLSYAITPEIDFSVQYQGAVYIIAGGGAVTGGITYHF